MGQTPILVVPPAFLELSSSFDWPRLIANFEQFMAQRWQRPLLKGRALPLFPHAVEATYAAAHLSGLREFIGQYVVWLQQGLQRDTERMLTALLGDKAQLLDREILAAELAAADSAPLILRPDMILTPDAAYILEFNLCTGLGGLFELEQMLGLYLDVPELKAAVLRSGYTYPSPLRALAELCDELQLGTLAVVDAGASDTSTVTEYLNRFRRQGKAVTAMTTEFSATAAGLALDGCSIDSWYGNMTPRGYFYASLKPLWQAVKAGKLKGPSRQFELAASSKAGLALLRQARHLGQLQPEFAAAVDRFIPETVLVQRGSALWHGEEVNALTLCLEQQEALVLKAADSEMGVQVFFGRSTSPERWHQLTQEALTATEPWVAQQYFAPTQTLSYSWSDAAQAVEAHACRAVVSPYFFGRCAGMGARLSLGAEAKGPLVAPEIGDCAFNYVALPTF